MTDDEARKLGTRMIDTWPNGPRAYVWRDAFLHNHLDPTIAANTYRALERSSERAPTISQFLATYHSIARRTDDPLEQHHHTPTRHTEEIDLTEYLTRLAHRAAGGDTAADTELDTWNRWLNKPATAEGGHR